MPLDSIFIKGLSHELNEALCGARIDKIHMPFKDKIILYTRRDSQQHKLLISGGSDAKAHITWQKYDNPPQPPMLCMFLRKHLLNGRILQVVQAEHERIIEIVISSMGELFDIGQKRLICEMTGRMTNIILVDEENIILACLKTVGHEGTARPVAPGLIYRRPPAPEKPSVFEENYQSLLDLCQKGPADDMFSYLSSRLGGLSPMILREFIHASGGDAAALARLLAGAKDIVPQPFLLIKDNAPFDFAPINITHYPNAAAEKAEGFSLLLDDFYKEKERSSALKSISASMTKTMESARGRITRKLAHQQAELKSAQNREDFKRRAELITSNLHLLKKGDKKALLTDYYSENLEQIEIALDENLTPQQNAQKLFKKYAKLKTAENMLLDQISKGQDELLYVENVLYSISSATSAAEIAVIRGELEEGGYLKNHDKTKKKPKPPAFAPRRFSVDGFDIFCGRTSGENDALTHRKAEKNDMWFHAKNVPGAHVVVFTKGAEIPDSVMEAAARIAAFYSSAKGKTVVDYALIRHVKKPPASRPGAVIYTNFKSLLVEGALPQSATEKEDY